MEDRGDGVVGEVREEGPPSSKRRRKKASVLQKIFSVQAVLGIAFTAWQWSNYQAQGVDPALLRSDRQVTVRSDDETTSFLPRPDRGKSGLVFLPGAMVDPDAYVPLLQMVARRGHPVVLIRLPWRTAPTASNRKDLDRTLLRLADRSDKRRWVLAGHSRGGALASAFAAAHPGRYAGLVLIGTTHPKEAVGDLSAQRLDVTKILGDRDGVAPMVKARANAHLLPPSTHWVIIEGGNHAQFGYYGSQLGDDEATISRERQHELTADALAKALARASRAH